MTARPTAQIGRDADPAVWWPPGRRLTLPELVARIWTAGARRWR